MALAHDASPAVAVQSWPHYWVRRNKALSLDAAQTDALAAAFPHLIGVDRFRRLVVAELGPAGQPPHPEIAAYLDRLHVAPSLTRTVATLTTMPEALQTLTLSFLDQESVVSAAHAAPTLFQAGRQRGARSHVDLGEWRKDDLDEVLEAEGPSRGAHLEGATHLDEDECAPARRVGVALAQVVGRMRHLRRVTIRSPALLAALPPLVFLKALRIEQRGYLEAGTPTFLTAAQLRALVPRPGTVHDLGGSLGMSAVNVPFWRRFSGVRRVRLESVDGVGAGTAAAMRDAWPLLQTLEVGPGFDEDARAIRAEAERWPLLQTVELGPVFEHTGALLHAIITGARSPPALILRGEEAPDPAIARAIPGAPRVCVLSGVLDLSGHLLEWLRRLRPEEVDVRLASGIPVDALAAVGAASLVRRMKVWVAGEDALQGCADPRYVVDHEAGRLVDLLTVHVAVGHSRLDGCEALVRAAAHVRRMEVYFRVSDFGYDDVVQSLRVAGTRTVDVVHREQAVVVVTMMEGGLPTDTRS